MFGADQSAMLPARAKSRTQNPTGKLTLSKVIFICSRPFRLCLQAWLDSNANLGLSPFSEFLTSKDVIDLGAENGALFI